MPSFGERPEVDLGRLNQPMVDYGGPWHARRRVRGARGGVRRRVHAPAGEEGHAGRPVGGPSGLRSMLAPSGRRIKQHPIEADSNCNGKRMEFKDLTPEQQDIAHTCKTPEDMVPFPKKWVTSFQMPSSQTWRAAWTGVATIKSALRTTPNRIPSRLRCGISLWSFEATLRSVDNLSRPKAGM